MSAMSATEMGKYVCKSMYVLYVNGTLAGICLLIGI